MDTLQILTNQLKKIPELVDDDNQIKKNLVAHKINHNDPNLIDLIFDNTTLKAKFFQRVGQAYILKKDLLIEFILSKNYLPDSYTKYPNKIGLNLGSSPGKGSVVLDFPFKDCLLEGGQSKQESQRDEIFFNQILAQDEITQLREPKVLSCPPPDSKKPLSNHNLIIDGNNLLALYCLKERYQNQIKLIYIDPPYNTQGPQSTFTYNNSFNHSTWLTFMKNRLEVAKELLSDDGFICVAIDHWELFYLGVLMDEIFNRDNRLGTLTIVHQPAGRQWTDFFSPSLEYTLVYAKDKTKANFNSVAISQDKIEDFNLEDQSGRFSYKPFIRPSKNPEDDPKHYYPIYVSPDLEDISLSPQTGHQAIYPTIKGQSKGWLQTKATAQKNLTNKELTLEAHRINGQLVINRKYREKEVLYTNWQYWAGKKYINQTKGTSYLKKLLKEDVNFSYPKSYQTIIDILKITTNKNDIVLDFFAGSGTTGEAVLRLNSQDGGQRKFILVEQLEEHINICQRRIDAIINQQKLADNYLSIKLKKYNQIFVDQIKMAQNIDQLLIIWRQMKAKSFLGYNLDINAHDKEIKAANEKSLDQQKQKLGQLLDKNQLYVNLSSLYDEDLDCSPQEIAFNQKFYRLDASSS